MKFQDFLNEAKAPKTPFEILKGLVSPRKKTYIFNGYLAKIVKDEEDELVVEVHTNEFGTKIENLIDKVRLSIGHEHNHKRPSQVTTTEDGVTFKTSVKELDNEYIVSLKLTK